MDAETETLRDVLRERERLRLELSQTYKPMHKALDAWVASRPDTTRGKATEAGATFLLRQAGIL